MVDDLLEISRVDTGSAELLLDEVEVGDSSRGRLCGRGGRGPIDIDPTLAGTAAHVDKRRIVRVVANLVDNTTQYAGGVPG